MTQNKDIWETIIEETWTEDESSERHEKIKEAIVYLLQVKGPMTAGQIGEEISGEEISLSVITIVRCLKSLHVDRRITKTSIANGPSWYNAK